MERFVSWFQIVSNFAVLLGLLLVGFQLYQDREFKRIELLDQGWLMRIERSRDLMGESMGETMAKAALEPESLSDTERFLMAIYFDSVISHRRRNVMLEHAGLRDLELRQSTLPFAFETEVGKEYLRFLVGEAKSNTDYVAPFTSKEGMRYNLRLDPKTGDLNVERID